MRSHSTRPESRPCQRCGTPFTPTAAQVRDGYGKYCSQECYFGPRITVACERCGKSMERRPSDIKGRIFCSKACMPRVPPRGCPTCHKPFATDHADQKYCSRECYWAAKRSAPRNHPSKRVVECHQCGVAFGVWPSYLPLRKFCSKDCYTKDQAGRQPKGPLEERFWSKVNKNGPIIYPELGPCWMWTGYCSPPQGHGQIGISGKKHVGAHRFALELKLGRPLLPKMQACHHCDNPPCVRDAHLFEGTALDNSQDMVVKGRHANMYRKRIAINA